MSVHGKMFWRCVWYPNKSEKTRPKLVTSTPDARTLTSRGRMGFNFSEVFWVQVVLNCPGAMENHRSTVIWKKNVQFDTPCAPQRAISVVTWSLTHTEVGRQRLSHSWIIISLLINFDTPHPARATCQADFPNDSNPVVPNQNLLDGPTPLWRSRRSQVHSTVDIGISKDHHGMPSGPSYSDLPVI